MRNLLQRRHGRVRFDLKVLRARGLVATDDNFVSEASSDAYCLILVDGVEIGKTSVERGTVDPVWRSQSKEVEAFRWSIVQILIRDEDKAMGEVAFRVEDWMNEERGRNPNRWLEVGPTKGCAYSGSVEVRLVLERERAKPYSECGDKDPRKVLRDGFKPNSMRRLSLSYSSSSAAEDEEERFSLVEFVWGHSEKEVTEMIARATTPVLLHVYDVGHSSWIANLNSTTSAFGGVFHGGVEVHGREFSFGGCEQADLCGIFGCKPRGCVLHTYRETVYLGDCRLGRTQVSSILKAMKKDWPGATYDMLRNNCCHFCNEFAIELGVGEIPSWTFRLAKVGAALKDAIGTTSPRSSSVSSRSSLLPQDSLTRERIESTQAILKQDAEEKQSSEEIQEHLLEHVMADRIQIMVRERSDRKVSTSSRSLLKGDTAAPSLS